MSKSIVGYGIAFVAGVAFIVTAVACLPETPRAETPQVTPTALPDIAPCSLWAESSTPNLPANVRDDVCAKADGSLSFPYYNLGPCAAVDSTNCYWDADLMGNGEGRSFVNLDGATYYPEGK